MQIDAIASLFDETRIVVPVDRKSATTGSAPLTGHNVSVVPLTVPNGRDLSRKLRLPVSRTRNMTRTAKARFVIKTFYRPVGQGSLHKSRTQYAIRTLFAGEEGLERLHKTVTQRAQTLPGLEALNKVTETIGGITGQTLTAEG